MMAIEPFFVALSVARVGHANWNIALREGEARLHTLCVRESLTITHL